LIKKQVFKELLQIGQEKARSIIKVLKWFFSPLLGSPLQEGAKND
jgi:hypothetical protein